MTAQTKLPPVDLTFDINCTPEHAFEIYTKRMSDWWPLETHSVDGTKSESCHMEGRTGGRIFERGASGVEHLWGTILEWVPPRRLRHTWHPGGDPKKPMEVTITFEQNDKGTRMHLVHTGWEHYGERANAVREGYVKGWGFVAGQCFAELAET